MSNGNVSSRDLEERIRNLTEAAPHVHASFAIAAHHTHAFAIRFNPEWVSTSRFSSNAVTAAHIDPNALADPGHPMPRQTRKYQYTERPKKRKEDEDGRVIGFLEILKKSKGEKTDGNHIS